MAHINESVEEVQIGTMVDGYRGEAFCKKFTIQTQFTITIGVRLSDVGRYSMAIAKTSIASGGTNMSLDVLWIDVAHPLVDGTFVPTNFESYIQQKIVNENPDFLVISSTGTNVNNMVPINSARIQHLLQHAGGNIHFYQGGIGLDSGGFYVATPDRGSVIVALDAIADRTLANGLYFVYNPF